MTWPAKGRRHTRADRATTAAVLERDHHRCKIRGPNCTQVATEDDHITPLHRGGSNNLDNRQAACHTCHGEKTQAEAATARAVSRAKATRPKAKHPGLI